jgi:hypothetical protein
MIFSSLQNQYLSNIATLEQHKQTHSHSQEILKGDYIESLFETCRQSKSCVLIKSVLAGYSYNALAHALANPVTVDPLDKRINYPFAREY